MSSTQIKEKEIHDGTQSQWSVCMQDICMVPLAIAATALFVRLGYKTYQAGSNWSAAAIAACAALAGGCYLIVSAIQNRPQKKSISTPAP